MQILLPTDAIAEDNLRNVIYGPQEIEHVILNYCTNSWSEDNAVAVHVEVDHGRGAAGPWRHEPRALQHWKLLAVTSWIPGSHWSLPPGEQGRKLGNTFVQSDILIRSGLKLSLARTLLYMNDWDNKVICLQGIPRVLSVCLRSFSYCDCFRIVTAEEGLATCWLLLTKGVCHRQGTDYLQGAKN